MSCSNRRSMCIRMKPLPRSVMTWLSQILSKSALPMEFPPRAGISAPREAGHQRLGCIAAERLDTVIPRRRTALRTPQPVGGMRQTNQGGNAQHRREMRRRVIVTDHQPAARDMFGIALDRDVWRRVGGREPTYALIGFGLEMKRRRRRDGLQRPVQHL